MVGAAVAGTVSAESAGFREPIPNRAFLLRGSSLLAPDNALALLFYFFGQYRAKYSLLKQVSDPGRQKVASKVHVLCEAIEKNQKRRAETSPAFSLEVFCDFFHTASPKALTFDSI